MNNLNELMGSVRSRMMPLLPILLIGFIGFGIAMFGVAKIMPAWTTHEDLSAGVDADNQMLQTQTSQQAAQDDTALLQTLIDDAHTRLVKAANTFLTQDQVDTLLSKLYRYADDSHVKITLLQAPMTTPTAQKAAPSAKQTATATAISAPYEVREFHLQVDGTLPQLMNFLARFHEAAIPSVIMSNVVTKKGDNGQASLTMVLLLHTSPYSQGSVLDGLPEVDPPTAIPPSPTPTFTLTPTLTSTPVPPTFTPGPATSTPKPTATSHVPTATPSPSAIPVVKCDGKAADKAQAAQQLVFSRTESGSTNCQAQVWSFQLDRNYAYVLDIKRRSGDGQYTLELRDDKGTAITTTQSSIEGRGILVAKTDAGTYAVLLSPTTATGDWSYSITLWKGMPSLSFAEVQSSYSTHSTTSAQPNVTTWRYTMPGGADSYRVEVTRTDGNLEYDVSVLDVSLKPIASGKSDQGKASVSLNTSGKVYYVLITAQDGTSGSFNITLVR